MARPVLVAAKPPPSFQTRLKRQVVLALILVMFLLGMFETTVWYFGGRTMILPRRTFAEAEVADNSTAAVEPKPVVKTPTRTPTPSVPKENRPVQPPPKPPERPPDPKPTPPMVEVLTYERHVLPIFQSRCVSCHGANKPKGNLDLRSYVALRKGGSSGPGFQAGVPKDSVLWERIADNTMPPGKNKLTDDEKTLIQKWIREGAKDALGAVRIR